MAVPLIQMTDLRRSFVVRDKAGRVRQTKRVVHAVDGITATIEGGQACGYIGANGAGKRLRQFLIGERQTRGTTLLLTTHDMSDIERLCERVLVVDHGPLVYDGTLTNLAARVAPQRVLVVDLWERTAPLHVAGAEHVGSELDGVRQRLAFSPEVTTAARVLAEVSAQVEVRDLTLEEPAIEDIVRTPYHRSG
jgi:ABC-2 type transport system ATP-binding protein